MEAKAPKVFSLTKIMNKNVLRVNKLFALSFGIILTHQRSNRNHRCITSVVFV